MVNPAVLVNHLQPLQAVQMVNPAVLAKLQRPQHQQQPAEKLLKHHPLRKTNRSGIYQIYKKPVESRLFYFEQVTCLPVQWLLPQKALFYTGGPSPNGQATFELKLDLII